MTVNGLLLLYVYIGDLIAIVLLACCFVWPHSHCFLSPLSLSRARSISHCYCFLALIFCHNYSYIGDSIELELYVCERKCNLHECIYCWVFPIRKTDINWRRTNEKLAIFYINNHLWASDHTVCLFALACDVCLKTYSNTRNRQTDRKR